MKNLLFVLYHDFTANSATHVHNLATRLMADGWDCAVAVPLNKESVCRYGTPPYRVFTYGECLASRLRFADGRGPDLMHVWTPREIVRRFTESLLARERARLLIHLEDNEEAITKRALRAVGNRSRWMRISVCPITCRILNSFEDSCGGRMGSLCLWIVSLNSSPVGSLRAYFTPASSRRSFIPAIQTALKCSVSGCR